ncbi:MAG: site-specific integrase [Saprospiraceae bacterium]
MTKVTLRRKKINDGKLSLYLDFYPPIIHPQTGKPTRREFLKLYILQKPRTEPDRELNKETLDLAARIQAKRQVKVQQADYGFLSKGPTDADFVEYFRELAAKRKGSNSDNWQSALYYLEDFTGGALKFSNLTEKFGREFREYLLTAPSRRSDQKPLAQNSAVSYFNKFKATLKQAFKDGLLPVNLNARIEPIKQAETKREFLTLEELNALVKAECSMPVLKRAALFSALTGLRFSDIHKLTWSEVRYSDKDGYSVSFRQKKTDGVEVLPISDQARELLGEAGEADQRVFTGLKYSAWHNVILRQWVLKAGITKDITFHCFRHTFATLQLTEGTDIYTVSKMLGHRELKTTQIYAKIIDEKKREAANKIKLDL